MNYVKVNIDHLGIMSKDLSKVKKIMESLGFFSGKASELKSGISGELPPTNLHYMMDNTYLECIESRTGDYLSEYLQGETGLHTIVLATDDIHKSHMKMKLGGYNISEVLSAERSADHGKNKGIAKFDWIKIQDEFIPNTLLGIVEHKTPELIFQPGRYQHGNGVYKVEALIVNCENQKIIKDFENANSLASRGEKKYLENMLPISEKECFGNFKPVLSEEASKYIGLIFNLENLSILKDILIKNKVKFFEENNKIIVDLQKELNLFFIFKE